MKKFTMKTEEMAEYLSVDPSFLKKNRNILFLGGVHYTYPDKDNIRMLRWIVSAMELWMMGQSTSIEEQALLDRLVS
jgi:hypothetical protein